METEIVKDVIEETIEEVKEEQEIAREIVVSKTEKKTIWYYIWNSITLLGLVILLIFLFMVFTGKKFSVSDVRELLHLQEQEQITEQISEDSVKLDEILDRITTIESKANTSRKNIDNIIEKSNISNTIKNKSDIVETDQYIDDNWDKM